MLTVREAINKHRGAAAAMTLIFVVLVIGFSVYRSHNEVAQFGPAQDKAWFTVDDGKSYFAGPLSNTSPFDHEGKKAYRCFVFVCDGGSRFVGFLERDVAKPAAPAGQRQRPMAGGPSFPEVKAVGTGDTGWVGQISPQGMKLLQTRCPDGKLAHPVPP